jgi:S1/P1 Nuclease
MLEKLVGSSKMTDAQTWANTIINAIDSGTYASSKASWLSTTTLSDPISSALSWSADANAFVCSNVLPQGVSAIENADLGGAYYDGNTAIFQEMIAKAGYRLAAWLNLINDGKTGLSKRDAAVATVPKSYNMYAADENSAARLARRAWEETHEHSC